MALITVAILLMLIGLAGVLLPFLPGVPIAWLGLFIFDYGTNFAVLPQYASLVFFILMIFSVVMEYVLPLLGAKKYKASNYGLIGAGIGLIVGPFVFSLAGVVIGPLLGAIVGEYLAGKDKQAIPSGIGTFVGFAISMISRLVLVVVMIGYFIFYLVV